MQKNVLNYFSEEMAYLREGIHQFAQKYPHLAPYLNTYTDKGADPDMARLLEAFALISSRIRVHQDTQFQQLNKDLLEILFPHAAAPIPSMAIVQLSPSDSQDKAECLQRGELLEGLPLAGERLTMQTCYNTAINPITMKRVSVSQDARTITCQIASLDKDKSVLEQMPDSLRLFINLPSEQAWSLYDSLVQGCTSVEVRTKRAGPLVNKSDAAIRAVGFSEGEAMQILPGSSQPVWRLLSEYFTFREKFLFVDVPLEIGVQESTASEVFIQFHFKDKLPTSLQKLSNKQLLLHCTPVINLFEKELEPISISTEKMRGQLRCDLRFPTHYDIHSLLQVRAVDGDNLPGLYRPDHKQDSDLCWYTQRQYLTNSADEISRVSLLLAAPKQPAAQPGDNYTLETHALCFNGNLPAQINLESESNQFQSVSGNIVLSGIHLVTQPTTVLPALFDSVEHPMLIASLSHSYLSLHDSKQASSFIHQSLDNADRLGSEENKVVRDSILKVDSKQVIGRSNSSLLAPFVYGTELQIELNKEQLIGQSIPLLKNILCKSFDLESYMNSFVQWAFVEV